MWDKMGSQIHLPIEGEKIKEQIGHRMAAYLPKRKSYAKKTEDRYPKDD
jgi:hypothetical protein